MKLQLLICLAGGALIAGLRPEPQQQSCCRSTEVARTSCAVDTETLGLSSEQLEVLERLCRTECLQVDQLEAQSRAALDRFYTRLADAEARPDELHALAIEVSEVRARALTALVDAIVEVRTVLEPEQLERLVSGCCRKDA